MVVESPAGARSVIVLDSAGPRPLELRRHGFYEIRALEGKPGRETVVAVNPDPAESDLAAVDPEEIALAVAAPAGAGDRTATLAAALTPGEKERRQALWWYLLLGAILVLLVESAVGHRALGDLGCPRPICFTSRLCGEPAIADVSYMTWDV